LFNLFEVFEISKTSLGKGPFTNLDEETVRATLDNYLEFCQRELAPTFFESDRVPLQFDGEGTVTLPAGLKRSLKSMLDAGWHQLAMPERLDGVGAPPSVTWAAFEFTAGANPCVAFYAFGAVITRIIDELGTDAQRRRFV